MSSSTEEQLAQRLENTAAPKPSAAVMIITVFAIAVVVSKGEKETETLPSSRLKE